MSAAAKPDEEIARAKAWALNRSPFALRNASLQSDAHHVQANLPTATTTAHPMRNRRIETAKSACFLNSLRLSLIRVVRRKKIERTKRKIGIAATTKAIILKIIVHCQFCCSAALMHVRCWR